MLDLFVASLRSRLRGTAATPRQNRAESGPSHAGTPFGTLH